MRISTAHWSEVNVTTPPRSSHEHDHKDRVMKSWLVRVFCLVVSVITLGLGIILLSKSIEKEYASTNMSSLTVTSRIAISNPNPSLSPALYEACLTYDHEITIPVNIAEIVDLAVAVCPNNNKKDNTSPERTPPVKVGGIVEATLDSTGPGTITPIGNSAQPIDPSREGTWSWKVVTTQPGDFELSLVITAYDDKKSVIRRNERISVPLHVVKTYRIDRLGAFSGGYY